ncbi:MAG: VWA domain-containing protein, partial [Victivallales bacterium]|nr:VWA domain-containing protein [Victivallales bacterium]
MISLEHPWQLLQGVAVLLLLLLYLWRRRSRRLKVAALFLWPEESLSHSSGRRFRLLAPPVRFWLEALAILALAVAAATPFWVRRAALPPLVVVLDNSFSLQAKQANGQTAQSNLKTRIQRLLAQRGQRQIRFILAGAEPALLPPEISLKEVFERWECMAGGADLSAAIALAHQSVPGSQTLVCTDHTPKQSLSSDVGWECQGTPQDNLAIVNLRRSGAAILVEVGNFSGQDRQAELECSLGTSQSLNLPANQTIHCRLPLSGAASNQAVSVLLRHAGDALPLDDKGVLLPASRPPLTCWLSPALPPASRQALQRALEANPDCLLRPEAANCELLCGDSTLPAGAYHRLLWHTASRPVLSTPLPADSTHPLHQGLSWKNILWPAQPD